MFFGDTIVENFLTVGWLLFVNKGTSSTYAVILSRLNGLGYIYNIHDTTFVIETLSYKLQFPWCFNDISTDSGTIELGFKY